jgi:hypothetical protein
MKAKITAEDTFIAALHLTAVELHELWSDGRPVISEGYAPDSLRIANLGAGFSSYVASPHEALSFYIPTTLNGFADEAGGPPVADLRASSIPSWRIWEPLCYRLSTVPTKLALSLSISGSFMWPSRSPADIIQLQRQEVTHHRRIWADVKLRCFPLNIGIGIRQAMVLAQMLRP